MTIIIGLLFFSAIFFLVSCNTKRKEKSDKEVFEEALNDPRINSREVGESEGIKYFQYMENGKTGFRDLDGKIVIKAIYESAEMFSENHSAVEVDGKWGLINEQGEYILKPQFESLGSLHNGLLRFSIGDKVGFIDIHGKVIIEPKFFWADDFSEGICSVSTDFRTKEVRKYGYIDTTGKLIADFQFEFAQKFENGKGKIKLNNLWGAVDKTGKLIEPATHKYTSDW